MIAHVAGVPLEEALLPLLSGLGAGLLLARAWFATRFKARKTKPQVRTRRPA